MKNTIQNLIYNLIEDILGRGIIAGYIEQSTKDKIMNILRKEMKWEADDE